MSLVNWLVACFPWLLSEAALMVMDSESSIGSVDSIQTCAEIINPQ